MTPDKRGTGTPGDGLRAERITREAGGRIVLDGVSIAPPSGATVGLLGPNGSGKTTLLRVMAGVLTPGSGVVTLDGRTLAETGRRAVARRVAVVDQHADTLVDLSVLDVVRLGRIPHRRAWSASGPEDEAAVHEALARTGLAGRATQSWHTLSGVSASGSRSPAPSPSSRGNSCWTNPPTIWTSSTSWSCCPWSPRCP